jgi:hypothetical protein
MKKFLVLSVLAGTLFAARYPMVIEYNYLKGCIGNKAMENYCICTLNAIENKYTLTDFMGMIQDKAKAKVMINYAVAQCINKMKK